MICARASAAGTNTRDSVPDVLIMMEEGREPSAEALVTELEILGFRVALRDRLAPPGVQGEGDTVRLVIVLEAEGAGKMRREPEDSWQEADQAPGEPPDHFALRIAELVRAQLLSEPAEVVPASKPAFSRSISTTFSQRLLLNGYGSIAGGIGQDVSFWFGRFALGPIGAFSLTRQRWNADPKKFSLRLGSLGLLTKYSLAPTSDELFEVQVLGSVAATSLLLREDGGKDEDRFFGAGWGLQAGGGVDLSIRATPHLRLGGQALTEVVQLLTWPEDKDGKLGGKEADLLVAASEPKAPRLHVVLALGVTGQW